MIFKPVVSAQALDKAGTCDPAAWEACRAPSFTGPLLFLYRHHQEYAFSWRHVGKPLLSALGIKHVPATGGFEWENAQWMKCYF